jgi:ATP-dependent protease Clp ATPase subunit
MVIDRMANTIRTTQTLFNKAQDDLEKLDGKSRLKILVEPKKDLIESYFHIFNRYDDDEEVDN